MALSLYRRETLQGPHHDLLRLYPTDSFSPLANLPVNSVWLINAKTSE